MDSVILTYLFFFFINQFDYIFYLTFQYFAYFTYNYRATLNGLLRSQVVPVIVINLLIGFMSSNIDVSAHIGGLIGGVLASMAIGLGDKNRKSDQINGTVVLLIMIVAMVYFVIIK